MELGLQPPGPQQSRRRDGEGAESAWLPGGAGSSDGSAQDRPGDGAAQSADDTQGEDKALVLLRFTADAAAMGGAALAEVLEVPRGELPPSQAGLVNQCPISWIREMKSHTN